MAKPILKKSVRKAATGRGDKPSAELDTPLYNQVTAMIRGKIERGELKRGDKIPSLRTLSQDLGIAYATVARGVHTLIKSGVLEAKQGRGGTQVALGRGPRKNAIGIIAEFSYEHAMTETRYYRQLLMLLQSRIIQAGQTILFRGWDRSRPLTSEFDNLSQVDALVFFDSSTSDIPAMQAVRRLGVPVVSVGDRMEDSRIPYVHSDNLGDCYHATEQLLAQGHTHIAHIEMVHHQVDNLSYRRAEGYFKAMQDAGHPKDPSWSLFGTGIDTANAILKLSPAPTAVVISPNTFFFSDFYKQLKDTPLEPGKNLFICAYHDNLWNILPHYQIPRCVVEHPMDLMADRVMEMIQTMLDTPDKHPGGTLIPSRLVFYDSKDQITQSFTP